MEELISVLIPAYNVEKYIGSCLESVLAQTYENIEIVIVDDGSIDSTLSICNEYKKKNDNIKVVHKQNGGVSSARNMALEVSNGDMIAWIDADDFVSPNYIETLYYMMKKENADITVAGFEKFVDNPPQIHESDDLYCVCDKYYPLRQMTFDYIWLVQWGKLIKKELYDGIKYPEGKNHEDEFVMYKVYYRASKIAYSSNILYFYRENPESIMGKKYNESRLLVLEALRQRVEFYEEQGEEELARLTILKLLGMYRNHFYLVKENLGNQSLMDDLYCRYMELFYKNKKRCGIKIYKQPELYIIPHQQYKCILRLLAKIKHKLGFIYW